VFSIFPQRSPSFLYFPLGSQSKDLVGILVFKKYFSDVIKSKNLFLIFIISRPDLRPAASSAAPAAVVAAAGASR